MRSETGKLVEKLRSLIGNSEVAQWPTCLLCTSLTMDRAIGGNWVPVEGYQIDPQVFRPLQLVGGGDYTLADILNPPRLKDSRGWFTVIAQCHRKETKAEIDVPRWWQTEHVRAAIQSLMFFGETDTATHRERTHIR